MSSQAVLDMLNGFGFQLSTYHALSMLGLTLSDETKRGWAQESRRVMRGMTVGRLVPTRDGRFMLGLAALRKHVGILNAFANATYVLWWKDQLGALHPWILRHYAGVDGDVTVCEHRRTRPVSHDMVQIYFVLSDFRSPANQRPIAFKMPLKEVTEIAIHGPGVRQSLLTDVRFGHVPELLRPTVVDDKLLSVALEFSTLELGHQGFYQDGVVGGRRGED